MAKIFMSSGFPPDYLSYFVILQSINYFSNNLIGRQGPSGPPGKYDSNLDEISVGPIGPQGT